MMSSCMAASSSTLARLKRAAAAKERADERYRALLLAALDEGYSYSDIARALNTSRQRIHQYVQRNGKPQQQHSRTPRNGPHKGPLPHPLARPRAKRGAREKSMTPTPTGKPPYHTPGANTKHRE